MKDIEGFVERRTYQQLNAGVCPGCVSGEVVEPTGHDSCVVCERQDTYGLQRSIHHVSSSVDVIEVESNADHRGVEVMRHTVKQGEPLSAHVYVKDWFERMRSGVGVFKPVFSEDQVHQATKFRFTNELFFVFSPALIGLPSASMIVSLLATSIGGGAYLVGLAGFVGASAVPFGLRKLIFGHNDKSKDKFFKDSVAVNRKGFAIWLMNRYGIIVSDDTLESLFPDSRAAFNELKVIAESQFEDVKGNRWKLVRSDVDGFYVESLDTRINEAHSFAMAEPVQALESVGYGLPAECQNSVQSILEKIAVLAEEGKDSAEVQQVIERARGELSQAVQLFDRLARLGREKDGVQQLAEVLALLNKHLDDTVTVLAAGVVSDFTVQSSFLRQVVIPPASLQLDKDNSQ